MGVAIRKTKAELGLADLYQGARRYLPGGEEITAVRAAAFDRFNVVGLPHRRVEAWRYTDLRTQMKEAKRLASLPDDAAKAKAREARDLFAGAGFRKLVIVDGAFVPELSDLAGLEPGLTIQPMADALAADKPLLSQRLGAIVPDDDPALALNTALAANGVVILVAPGTALSRPIHVAFVTTNWVATSMFTRSLVNIGAGASATIVESHQGPDGSEYQVNTAMQLIVGDEARIDHIKVVSEGSSALHIGSLLANIGARATFNQLGFVAGGSLVRNQLFVRLAGEGTVADIRGGALLSGTQHADTTLSIEHAAENGQSRETFKAVVGDTARAVFQGKITVAPGAQKTDAKMMSRALLLSDEAEADSKPELEIFADDVQCGHGTTTGAIDDELLFYLMARGIPPAEAKALLIQAFIGEIIEGAANEAVRDALTGAMLGWLGRRE
ncbi:Fe-S cluster assembly protein SufD [Bradyrhizobium sp. SRS-191]|uniref:Fe-S cluster assembly protein SufD n=1 Tax=Bradyrhizobium sp. SRS-191 TaxID=2962606 RepID=UPI00211EF78C|nr:Fe-S cluster assembly protein SufD [Bradyrhizobium sp. SRS-191]